MVPTLIGRLQTRLFLLLVIGSAVTGAVTPLLPLSGPPGTRYRETFLLLVAVMVLGLGWELVYHFLMQFRWEKDWPTLLGLVTGLLEGTLLWRLLVVGAVPGVHPGPSAGAFLAQFCSVWVSVWLVANGPMRVPFLRWRFHGGRVI